MTLEAEPPPVVSDPRIVEYAPKKEEFSQPQIEDFMTFTGRGTLCQNQLWKPLQAAIIAA
jgi:hypothetical protein